MVDGMEKRDITNNYTKGSDGVWRYHGQYDNRYNLPETNPRNVYQLSPRSQFLQQQQYMSMNHTSHSASHSQTTQLQGQPPSSSQVSQATLSNIPPGASKSTSQPTTTGISPSAYTFGPHASVSEKLMALEHRELHFHSEENLTKLERARDKAGVDGLAFFETNELCDLFKLEWIHELRELRRLEETRKGCRLKWLKDEVKREDMFSEYYKLKVDKRWGTLDKRSKKRHEIYRAMLKEFEILEDWARTAHVSTILPLPVRVGVPVAQVLELARSHSPSSIDKFTRECATQTSVSEPFVDDMSLRGDNKEDTRSSEQRTTPNSFGPPTPLSNNGIVQDAITSNV